jgi:hypothetical protein
MKLAPVKDENYMSQEHHGLALVSSLFVTFRIFEF